MDGDRKLFIFPPPDDLERARRELDEFIDSGEARTPAQDVEFAVRHLVEVAVRALSPGINDPFTALAVIDRLRGGLARLCGRELPSKAVFGSSGRLRLSRDATSYRGIVDEAFHQIRQSGEDKPAVLVHLLAAIGAVAEHVRTDEQVDALRHHAELVQRTAERNLEEPCDLQDVEQVFDRAMRSLDAARSRSEGRRSGGHEAEPFAP